MNSCMRQENQDVCPNQFVWHVVSPSCAAPILHLLISVPWETACTKLPAQVFKDVSDLLIWLPPTHASVTALVMPVVLFLSPTPLCTQLFSTLTSFNTFVTITCSKCCCSPVTWQSWKEKHHCQFKNAWTGL